MLYGALGYFRFESAAAEINGNLLSLSTPHWSCGARSLGARKPPAPNGQVVCLAIARPPPFFLFFLIRSFQPMYSPGQTQLVSLAQNTLLSSPRDVSERSSPFRLDGCNQPFCQIFFLYTDFPVTKSNVAAFPRFPNKTFTLIHKTT